MIEIVIVVIICISIACSISSATGTGIGTYLYTSVDGGWSEWSDGKCDLDCGGERIRTRKCNNPVPFGTGTDCEGEEQEILDCSPCITKEDIKKEAEKNALKNKNDAEKELQLVKIKQKNDAEKELQLVKIKQKNDADDEKRKAIDDAIEDDILTFDDLTGAGVSVEDAEFLLDNLEDNRDDSTFINNTKKKISVLLNKSPRYQENKSSKNFRSKNTSLVELLKILRTQIKNNKTEVIPAMGSLIGDMFSLRCPEDSHVTEINGSYKGYMREFGIKCSDGKSFSSPRTSKAEEGDKLATRFSYKRNNGFDKMTINAGRIIDGIKINNNLAGGTGGAHLSKQCNNGRITGFAGTSEPEGILSSIAIFCDKIGIFSDGNISYQKTDPVPVHVPVPETIVKYNTIIHIAKNSSPGHKLGLSNGKAFETTGKGEETKLVLVSSLGVSGEVHYNQDLVIAKWHSTSHRLKMKSGKASEVWEELGDHTQFKIVGWTGTETGPVKLGDKVWIEKKNGDYQLSLYAGTAEEARKDKHKDQTQMNIVNF
jgi:hypothetical protein